MDKESVMDENIKMIEKERQVKEIMGDEFVCLIFPKKLTIEAWIKQLRRSE